MTDEQTILRLKPLMEQAERERKWNRWRERMYSIADVVGGCLVMATIFGVLFMAGLLGKAITWFLARMAGVGE